MKTYTIHRGTVRSPFALYHHVMPIYARHERARVALAEAEANGIVVRGERREFRAASARADEASKMHLVPFVPAYVPAKASRVYPVLKTCTSRRRAAKYVNDILRAQDDDAREDAWFVQRYAG